MALHWDVTSVADHATITTHPEDLDKTADQRWSPITDAVVWATMFVGINRITEANHAEFFERIALVEKVTGASLQSQNGPMYLTLDDIREHIGLYTNASSKTKAQFKEYIFNIASSASKGDAARRLRADGRSLRAVMNDNIKAAKEGV